MIYRHIFTDKYNLFSNVCIYKGGKKSVMEAFKNRNPFKKSNKMIMYFMYESGIYNKRLLWVWCTCRCQVWRGESRKGQLHKDTPSSTHRPALAAPRRAEAAWRVRPREALPTSLSKVRIWASSGASPGVKLLFPSKTPSGWLPLRVP